MVKYNPKLWFVHIFAFHKNDTLYILWKELLVIGLISFGLVYAEMNYFADQKIFKSLISVYSIIGFVLSLLLVFRTNTAYDRWWEGRKKWGAMVNTCRNLAIKINALSKDKEDRAYFHRMIANYPIAMRDHLRDGVQITELDLTAKEIGEIEKQSHRPSYISTSMYAKVLEMKKAGKLSEEEFLSLDENLNALTDIIGACERIKNTPIPYSYSLFLKKFIFIYVLTLPLAFVVDFGYWTIGIDLFIFYVLVSMEVLAEEIEDPFGTDANDLPTDDLCVKISQNTKDLLNYE